MNSQSDILKMTKEQVNQYLIKNIEKPTVVKMALQHPEIDVCYEYQATRPAFKKRTPIIHALEKLFTYIFTNKLYYSNYSYDINFLLESTKLMLEHHTYNKNFKYEYTKNYKDGANQDMMLQSSLDSTQEKEIKDFMKKGFKIKSLINNDKLINKLMEIGYKWFNYRGNVNKTNKAKIELNFKKVKEIVNICPPPILPKKSIPNWIVALVTVVITLVIGAGGFYGKKVLKPLPNWALVIITIISAIMLGGGGFYGRKTYVKRYK